MTQWITPGVADTYWEVQIGQRVRNSMACYKAAPGGNKQNMRDVERELSHAFPSITVTQLHMETIYSVHFNPEIQNVSRIVKVNL